MNFGFGYPELVLIALLFGAVILYQRIQTRISQGGNTMAVTLKEETILDEWSMLVGHAAEHGEKVIEAIEQELEAAQIPGDCSWELEEVKSSGIFSRVRRDFLIIKLDEFKDYRQYICARSYGIHLDVCRFMTVEPGFFKKTISEKLTGDESAFSAPKNILIHQDLSAWRTVVHHAVLDSVEVLVKELGQDPSKIHRESKGFLSGW